MYNTQKRPINSLDVQRIKALANSLSEAPMLSITESNQLLEMRALLNNVMLSPNDHSGQSFSPNQLDQRARMVILQIRQLVDHFQNEMFMGGPYNASYNPSIFNVNPFVSNYEPRFQQPGFATDASLNINDPTVKQYQGKCLSIEEMCKAVHGAPYNAVLLSDFEMDKIRQATGSENYGNLLRTDMACPNDLKDLGREIYNVFGFGKVFVAFLDHEHKIAAELSNRGISLSSEPLRSTSLRISVGKVQIIVNKEQPTEDLSNNTGAVFTNTIMFTLADVRQTLNSFVENKANFIKPAAFVLSAADCAKVIELANGSVIGDGTTFDVSSSQLSTHQHNVLRGLLNPYVETKVLFISDVDQVMTVLRDNGYNGIEHVSLDGPDVYAVKLLQSK